MYRHESFEGICGATGTITSRGCFTPVRNPFLRPIHGAWSLREIRGQKSAQALISAQELLLQVKRLGKNRELADTSEPVSWTTGITILIQHVTQRDNHLMGTLADDSRKILVVAIIAYVFASNLHFVQRHFSISEKHPPQKMGEAKFNRLCNTFCQYIADQQAGRGSSRTQVF